MLIWFEENIGTVLVAILLIAIIAAIVFNIVKNKKQGNSQCGCSCENCKMCSSCHK